MESNRHIFWIVFPIFTFFGKIEFFRSRQIASYLKKVRHPSCPPYHGNIDPPDFHIRSKERRQNGLTANFQFSKKARNRAGAFFRYIFWFLHFLENPILSNFTYKFTKIIHILLYSSLLSSLLSSSRFHWTSRRSIGLRVGVLDFT